MNKKTCNVLKVTLITSIILLAGCEKKIDASNPATLEHSIVQMSNSVDKNQAVQFKSALNSVFNYAYAKTHDGKIYSKGPFEFGFATSKLEDRPSEKEKINSVNADKIIISTIDGKSIEEIIKAKPQFDDAIQKMTIIRNKNIKEGEQKADFLVTEKTKLTNELIDKEQEKNKLIEIDESSKILNSEIQDTHLLLEKNSKEEEILRKKLEPYEMADIAFGQIDYKNVQIFEKEDHRKYIKFNLVNNSNLSLLTADFSYIISIEGKKDYSFRLKEKFEQPLQSKNSIIITIERAEDILKKIDDLSTVTFSIKFNSFDTEINGNSYAISMPNGEKSGPESYHSALSKVLSNGVELRNKLDFLNNQLHNITKNY